MAALPTSSAALPFYTRSEYYEQGFKRQIYVATALNTLIICQILPAAFALYQQKFACLKLHAPSGYDFSMCSETYGVNIKLSYLMHTTVRDID